MATDYTIESLVDEVCARFPDDPSTPAVLVSRLPSEEWYMSVARFTEPFGKGKQVVVSEKDLSSKMCLSLLWQRRETFKGDVLRDYARKDARRTLALAVEQKKARYNAGALSRPWAPAPSKSGRRGEELAGQRREIDVDEEVEKAGLKKLGFAIVDRPSRIPGDWFNESGRRSREVAEEVEGVRDGSLFGAMNEQVRKWVPRSMIYEARTILWHEPGGDVFVLKNGEGIPLPKFTQQEASGIVQMLSGLVICAFPCGYEKPRTQTYQAASVSVNEVQWTGSAEVSFSMSGKKKKAKEQALVPREVSRFGAIELDDEEES